jgi:hypothetical protein
MRPETLLYPGNLPQAHDIRQRVAAAITGVEIVAAATPGGKTQAAALLKAFLLDAADKLTPVSL